MKLKKLLEADSRATRAYIEALSCGVIKPLQEMGGHGASSGRSGNYNITRIPGPGYIGYQLVSATGFGQEQIYMQVMGGSMNKMVAVSMPQKMLKKLPSSTQRWYMPMPVDSSVGHGQFYMSTYSNQHQTMSLQALDKDLQELGATSLRQIEKMSSQPEPKSNLFKGDPYSHSPHTPEPEETGRGAWKGAYKPRQTGKTKGGFKAY